MKPVKPCLLFLLILIVLHARAYGRDYIAAIGGEIRGKGIHGDYVYLAQRDSIVILDARNRKDIREVARYSKEGQIIDEMVMTWPVIFYVRHEAGVYYHHLESIDITSPTQPRDVKLIEASPAKSMNVETSGSRLLIVRGGMISPYDISNPWKPVNLPSFAFENDSLSKTVTSDNQPYPEIPKGVVYPEDIDDIQVTGNRLCVLKKKGKVDAFDVSDPHRPQYIGPPRTSIGISAPKDVKIASKEDGCLINNRYKVCIVYAEGEDGTRRDLVILDMADKNHPKKIATLEEGYPSSNGGEAIWKFWMSGNILAVVLQTEHNTAMTRLALSLYNLSNPAKPRQIGYFEGFDGPPKQVVVSGNYAYVAEGENGLTIYSLGNESEKKL